MAKEVFIRDAEVLELYQGEFENDDNKKQPYYQLRVYQHGQQSDFLTVVKLKPEQLKIARDLVGTKVNLLTEQKSYGNKISYHFAAVA